MKPPSDRRTFLRAWLRAPLRTGAISPSSVRLARMMVTPVDPESGPVLELGPGTGVFTRALLRRGVAEADLTLLEADTDFARLLTTRHPKATVLNADAACLRYLAGQLRQHGTAVSGLPLLAMSQGKVLQILRGAFASLAPDGSFLQFTYGRDCPLTPGMLERLGLRAERTGTVLTNLPPASVYRFYRK